MKPTCSELPERPHAAPCLCEECASWARAVVATPLPKRALAAPSTVAAEMPLADFAQRMIATACRATGLSEEQLRARAEELGAELPETPPVELPSREVMVARGVPEKHLKAVYDRPPIDCEALRAVRDFLASEKTSLVLAGGTGTRKSGSACWALTQRPGVFITEDEVIRLQSSRLPEDVEAWRRARAAQVLVVDDIGEYSDDKGWGVKVITGLWNHRYSSELKLIVTVNKTRQEFVREFGERIADRIRESGRFVVLGGESVRRAPRREHWLDRQEAKEEA